MLIYDTMKKMNIVSIGIYFLLMMQAVYASPVNNVGSWKAGVAKAVITPKEPMWMAGYANRDHPAEGTLHDLWAKALILQDAAGKRSVLITLDLAAIPKDMSDYIRGRLKIEYKLAKAQILINCSHTHSGPVLTNSVPNAYDLNPDQVQKMNLYTTNLSKQIIQLVGEAINSLRDVEVYTENGFARFQVNRRNNNEPYLLLQPELKGPGDYAVPVIKIADKSTGSILAIAFGYACHNTVLNGYLWSGDYAGFAQLELEKMYPDAIALFFQGAGADQNPLPRRTIALAKQYGKELAFAVEAVLSTSMTKQLPRLSYAYSEVQLPLNPPPSKEVLIEMTRDSTAAYKQRSAAVQLRQLEKGIAPTKAYPYPVQVWKIGEQPLVALGGELVVHYSIEIKKLLGSRAFVLGYSNDIMSYIPSTEILRQSNDKEEGYAFYNPTNSGSLSYEGGLITQLLFGLPGTWASNIEIVILSEVRRLASLAGVPIVVYQ